MGEKVVDLKLFKEKMTPHMSGKVRCMHCKHEWIGVAPVGTDSLECPECGLIKGVYTNLILDEENFLCGACDSIYFSYGRILGWYCVKCGTKVFEGEDPK